MKSKKTKKKQNKKVAIWVVISSVVAIVAVILSVVLINKVSDKYYTLGDTGDGVCDELKGVYAFKLYKNQLILGMNKDNDENISIKRVDYAGMSDGGAYISYDSGRLYYADDFDGIYYIDLSSEKCLSGKGKKIDLPFEIDSWSSVGSGFVVVDDVVYVSNFENFYIKAYDLRNKTVTIIDGYDGEVDHKENIDGIITSDDYYNKIYYRIDSDSPITEYDIATKEKKEIMVDDAIWAHKILGHKLLIVANSSCSLNSKAGQGCRGGIYIYDIEKSELKEISAQDYYGILDKYETDDYNIGDLYFVE